MNRTTLCKETGCGKSVTNTDFCEAHKTDNSIKQYDAQRRESPHRKLYNLAIWKKLRAWQLGRFPMCQHKGCERPATVCDHIVDHNGDWSLFIGGVNGSNLQSLCAEHHNEKTMKKNIALGKMLAA